MQKIENFLHSLKEVHMREYTKKMTSINANANNANANANANANNKIFRYKLSDNIMELITQFAKIHQYADRRAYKEAWINYVNENREITDREVFRLAELNYKGDVMDKMFKAGRYYFRTKGVPPPHDGPDNTDDGPEENDDNDEAVVGGRNPQRNPQRTPRSYIVMQPDVIQAMDKQLLSIIKNANFKPAQGFIQFCSQNIDLLRQEITRLTSEGGVGMTAKTLADKIKKTYKNRYFMLKQGL